MVTQVLIEDVPPEYRHPVLRYYMEKLTNGKIACKVTLHGNRIAAAFQQPIGKRSFLKYTMIFEYQFCVCRYKFFDLAIKTVSFGGSSLCEVDAPSTLIHS